MVDADRLAQLIARARSLDDAGRDALAAEVLAADPALAAALVDAIARLEPASPTLAPGNTLGTWSEGTKGTWADGPTLEPTAHVPAASASPAGHLGRYRVIRRIGEGGMGVVYEAEQENPRRRVAVKVIRGASPALRRRFEFEAQVMGRLDHPGIARILEAVIEDERSWFAMEFVDGVPLDEFCEERDLDVDGVLELFARVADAVHHAHLNGVVHRDLKPANILVQADGQPKVLDFGIARAVDAEGKSETGQTRVGQIVGTPRYLSPEQAEEDPSRVDARSDVYALGVILYELLAGQAPYEIEGKSILEIVRIVHAVDATPIRRIRPELGKDVEAILEKALEKDRDRRYQSAAALAEDLRHLLADEPISARPVTTAVQLRRFARRNKALVGSLAALLAALLVGVIASTALFVRAEHARVEAVAARAALEQRTDALTRLQARARLESDPTASVAWLRTLGPDADWAQAFAIAHEARDRGVAHDLLIGTHDELRWAELSPDDTLAATASYDHEVRLWNLVTREVRVLAGHADDVRQVAFSRDGERLLSTGRDGVRLWSRDGTPLAAFSASTEWAEWAPDDSAYAAGLSDGTVRLVHGDGSPWRDLVGHTRQVEHVAWSADGALLASASLDGTVRVWTVATGESVVLRGHEGAVSQVDFDAGRHLVSAGEDHTARVWDLDTGEVRVLVGHTHEVRHALLSRDGATAVTASRDGTVRIWDTATGTSRVLEGHVGVIRWLDWSPDEATLATASEDLTVRTWDVATGRSRALLGHTERVRSARFSRDGRWLVSASADGTARIWATGRPPPARLLGHGAEINQLAAAPAGAVVATASDDGTVRAWDLTTGAEQVFDRFADVVEAVAVGPAGEIVGGGRDRVLRTWSPDGALLAEVPVDTKIRQVRASADGRWLAAAIDDVRVPLVDRETGEVRRLDAGTKGTNDVAFSPDSALLAAACADGGVWLWAVPSGPPTLLGRFADEASRVRFTPDSRTVVAAGADGTVRAWPVTGGPEARIATHEGPVVALAVGDGWVVSGGRDGVVRVRDGAGGVVADLVGHARTVTDVALIGDGASVVSVSEDGTLRVWDVASGTGRVLPAEEPLKQVAVADGGHFLVAIGDTAHVWPAGVLSDEASVERWLADLTTATIDAEGALSAPWTAR